MEHLIIVYGKDLNDADNEACNTKAERQQRAAAEEHARQMQEAREQAAWDRHVVETTEDEMQEREAQTPHNPLLALFESDLGRDIADFIRFLFIFVCV